MNCGIIVNQSPIATIPDSCFPEESGDYCLLQFMHLYATTTIQKHTLALYSTVIVPSCMSELLVAHIYYNIVGED